jgi:hypothetical protein
MTEALHDDLEPLDARSAAQRRLDDMRGAGVVVIQCSL